MRSILIGYGYWGKILEPYIRQSGKFELEGICGSHMEHPLDAVEMKKRGSIECAFVCVPVSSHFEVVSELLDNGLHVFCEKPLCQSLGGTKALFKKARDAGKTLFTDYIYTVSPSIKYMKEHLGILGDVRYIRMAIRQFGRFYQDSDVFEVLGVHMVSAVAYLFDAGPGEIMVVHAGAAACTTGCKAESGHICFRVRDIEGIIECSLVSGEKERKIELVCEHGAIIFDMLGEDTVRIIRYKEEGNKIQKNQELLETIRYDEKNNLRFALDSFYHAAETGETGNERISVQVAGVLEQVSQFVAVRHGGGHGLH